MTTTDLPEEGDFIEVTYDVINGTDDSHKGEVLEVEDDDPPGEGVEAILTLTDSGNNTDVHVHVGEFEGEDFCTISRLSEFSGPTKLGENAEWEVFG